MNGRCLICGHDIHDPGKCGKCNCGESDINHADALRFDVSYASLPGEKCPSRPMKHLRPRKNHWRS